MFWNNGQFIWVPEKLKLLIRNKVWLVTRHVLSAAEYFSNECMVVWMYDQNSRAHTLNKKWV
jgi:hypothetical protein